MPVPVFSQREAMGYLFDRLTTDPDQRSGAYDLAELAWAASRPRSPRPAR